MVRKVELPFPNQEMSISEITDRWCLYYIRLIPERFQSRSEVANLIISKIVSHEIYGERVHCMQYVEFSNIEVFQGVKGWMTWSVKGADLRLYEEKNFGIDSKLARDEHPCFTYSKRNSFTLFTNVRHQVEGAAVPPLDFITQWMRIGMPLYYLAKDDYHQSLNSDFYYLLKGFYRVRHGAGRGIGDLIDIFFSQNDSGSALHIYLALVQSIHGAGGATAYQASIDESQIYLHEDDIGKIELGLDRHLYSCESEVDRAFFDKADVGKEGSLFQYSSRKDLSGKQKLQRDEIYKAVLMRFATGYVPRGEMKRLENDWEAQTGLSVRTFKNRFYELAKEGLVESEHNTVS